MYLNEFLVGLVAHVPSTNMEEAGLMTYTAASQQVAIEMFWLHYGELSDCPSFIQSMVYFDSAIGCSWHMWECPQELHSQGFCTVYQPVRWTLTEEIRTANGTASLQAECKSAETEIKIDIAGGKKMGSFRLNSSNHCAGNQVPVFVYLCVFATSFEEKSPTGQETLWYRES